MLLYFANPKPTRKKLQHDREGTIGSSLGNQAVKTIFTRKEIHNTDRSPSFEMVETLQRPVIQTNEIETTTRGIWLRNRVQERKRKRSSRRPFKNEAPPINKVVEPDPFVKIEEINNHDELYEDYKHWKEDPTDTQYAKKTTDQNTYNWIQKRWDYLTKKHGYIK